MITTLLLREYENTGAINLARFYFRRAFRILPPLYFYILFVVVAATWLGQSAPLKDVLAATTLTQNLLLRTETWQFEHFWSLCIEEQFYLIWPLALLFVLSRYGRAPAARMVVLLIALAPILRVAVFVLVREPAFRHYLLGMLPAKMDGLMYGCWAALTVGTPVFERIYDKASAAIWLLPLWVGVISNYLTNRYGNFYSLIIGQSIDGLCVAVLLVWATRNPRGRMGRVLNWGPIVHLGLISYSVYIWQTWFLHVDNRSIFGEMPWSLFCIWVMAEVSYYGVERLSRMARRRFEVAFFKAKPNSDALASS